MKELDVFLDQVKDCTVEEFKRKFSDFIEQVDNRNKFINDLIFYFNNYRRSLNSQKERANKDIVSIIEMERVKCKKIIYYIKSQYEHGDMLRHNNYTSGSDSNKLKKKRNLFSQEIIELSGLLLNEEDALLYLNNYSIKLEKIIKVLDFLDYKSSLMHKRKKTALKKKNITYINQLTETIGNYKRVIGEIEQYIYQLILSEFESIPDLNHFDTSVLDFWYQQLKSTDDQKGVLSNIINFIHQEKSQYGFLYEKNGIFQYLEKRDYQNESMKKYLLQLKEFKEKMQLLERQLGYYINKTKKLKSDSHFEFSDEIEISSVQENIKESILQQKDVSGFDFVDFLYALADCIKNESISDYLLHYLNVITMKITSEPTQEEEIVNAIYFVLDAIKYRLSRTTKEEKQDREILKKIRTSFHVIHDQDNQNYKNHDYLFDLVNYFLQQEDYFLYLKKIVEVMPDIVNTRYINQKTHVSEHIVLYIVDQFIENYKIMLYDRNSDYINKDYLKIVYLLFTRCYKLSLTSDEKKQIDQKLANFIHEVNRRITSSKRKYAVKADLKEMYVDNFYLRYMKNPLNDLDEYDLDNHLNSFYATVRDAKKGKGYCMNFIEEEAFTLGRGYHAYSIEKNKHGFVLKIHVIALYHLIPSHSYLSYYLFNQTATSSQIDHMIIRQINMAKGEVYPTITYEIGFDEKGDYCNENREVRNFQIYPNKIKVNQKYSDYDLIYFNGEKDLRLCLDLYRKSSIRNCGDYHDRYFLKDVEVYFEKILEKGVIEYFQGYGLPFIYSGVCHFCEKEVVDIMNHIGVILSRLDKKDFDQIYRALSTNIDSFHYSTTDFHGEYQLAIENPLNYHGLLIQKVLFELVFDNRYSENEYKQIIQKIQREFDEVVASLNDHLGYIDVGVLSENKGKLFQKKKMYF